MLYIISRRIEGFEQLIRPQYKRPEVDSKLKDETIINQLNSSLTTNCTELGLSVGKIISVKNKLTDIRNQINTGTIQLEFARQQLDLMRNTEFLCSNRTTNTSKNINYCNTTDKVMSDFNAQMNPSSKFNRMLPVSSTNQPETVYDLNNYINQEFYYIDKYYSIIKTLGVSLRCDLFL
jgi:hypothetical protein